METSSLRFKVATEEREFEQIHQLNYQTFVEEIPQHEPNEKRALVDKFHRENTYVIALDGGKLAGMVAVRGKRPFSLDQKLDNLDAYLPSGCSPCEIRLLSVDKNYRRSRVFYGLMTTLARYSREQGYDFAVISGTLRQTKLYKHIGFQPFGPLVGTPDALYQPMYMGLERFVRRSADFFRSTSVPLAAEELVNLLPGPVRLSRKVRRSFAEAPVSHRSHAFMQDFDQARHLLCELVGAEHVQIFTGSGTLANDVVAAQLCLLSGRGLVLQNGEFGRRLVDHAVRWGLDFDTVDKEWGGFFRRDEVEPALDRHDYEWLWCTHCETSTGILNDRAMLQDACAGRGVRLCLDCISSIGAVPVDLSGLYLATCVSGKALRSFPGLSMVFHNHAVEPRPGRLPRYLDLGTYAARGGVPYTIPSNLVYALLTALKSFGDRDIFGEIRRTSAWLRGELRSIGYRVVAPDEHAAPGVVTIAVPPGVDSEEIGRAIERVGYLLSYRSEYLLERGWLQVCLMGELDHDQLESLVDVFRDLTAELSTNDAERKLA
ncbi:MAG: aminotransferase class V-fold PLP-dependent enzyme [Planctomycetota bacterium]